MPAPPNLTPFERQLLADLCELQRLYAGQRNMLMLRALAHGVPEARACEIYQASIASLLSPEGVQNLELAIEFVGKLPKGNG